MIPNFVIAFVIKFMYFRCYPSQVVSAKLVFDPAINIQSSIEVFSA